MVTDVCRRYLYLEEIIAENSYCFLLTIELFSGGISHPLHDFGHKTIQDTWRSWVIVYCNQSTIRTNVCDDFLQRAHRINQRGFCLRNLCPKHNLCVQSINTLPNSRFIFEFKVQGSVHRNGSSWILEGLKLHSRVILLLWMSCTIQNTQRWYFGRECDITPHTIQSGPRSGPRLQWSCIVEHDYSLPYTFQISPYLLLINFWSSFI